MSYLLEKSIRRLAKTHEQPSASVKEAVMSYVRANGFERRGIWLAWKLAGGGALAIVLLGGGVVTASQAAMPGNALYSVKLASENAYAKSQISPQSRAEVAQSVLERRLSEAQSLDAELASAESDEEWTLAMAQASDGWVEAQDGLFSLAVSHE